MDSPLHGLHVSRTMCNLIAYIILRAINSLKGFIRSQSCLAVVRLPCSSLAIADESSRDQPLTNADIEAAADASTNMALAWGSKFL